MGTSGCGCINHHPPWIMHHDALQEKKKMNKNRLLRDICRMAAGLLQLFCHHPSFAIPVRADSIGISAPPVRSQYSSELILLSFFDLHCKSLRR
jgi:hypothetical protein